MRPGDLPFWQDIVRARSRDEWTEADLVAAGQMARCMADVEREQALLDVEGVIVENDRGAAAVNPRAALLDSLVKRQLAYGRALRLGGRAAGDARDQQGRRKAERKFTTPGVDFEGADWLLA